MALTVTEVRNAAKRERDYKLPDSLGLYLFVTRTGAKSWRFKYRIARREKLLTFGLFPEVTLAEARQRRDEARAILRDGNDPAVELPRRKMAGLAAADSSFKAVAEGWMADQKPHWSPANEFRVRQRIERDLYPTMGKLPVASISGPLVLTALRKIEARGSIETAKRVKGYVIGIMKRAEGEHRVTTAAITAITAISTALKPNPVGSKQPALTMVDQLIELQRDVDRSTSSATVKLASRLLALTVVRIGVLRTAPWSEFSAIDWADPGAPAPNAVWNISAERMKLDVEDKGNEAFGHDVALSPQAVAVLRALHVVTGHYPLLFPSSKAWREPMSDSTVSSVYKRIVAGKYKGRMVPHGWRSAFSTIMNERAAELERDGDRMIIDMMLAHVPQGMSASEWAYNRARYIKPRKALGAVWAEMITAGLASPFTLIGQVGG